MSTEAKDKKEGPLFYINYTVTEQDVDPVYKHVDHTRSLKLLELCRLHFLEALKFPNEQLFVQKLFPVVVAIRAYYRREVLQENITITCEKFELFERTFTMHQKLLNQKGKLAIDAEVDWLFMDGRTKRAIDPPPGFLDALQNFKM